MAAPFITRVILPNNPKAGMAILALASDFCTKEIAIQAIRTFAQSDLEAVNPEIQKQLYRVILAFLEDKSSTEPEVRSLISSACRMAGHYMASVFIDALSSNKIDTDTKALIVYGPFNQSNINNLDRLNMSQILLAGLEHKDSVLLKTLRILVDGFAPKQGHLRDAFLRLKEVIEQEGYGSDATVRRAYLSMPSLISEDSILNKEIKEFLEKSKSGHAIIALGKIKRNQ